MSMNPHPPADWLEFWVRFVCGAIFGVAMGLLILVNSTATAGAGWMLLGSVVTCALLAGWLGDRFWYSLRHLFLWW